MCFSLYAARFIRGMHTAEAEEDIQFVQEYAYTDPVVEDILKSATDRAVYLREVGAWIRHDVDKMIRQAQRRGIKVILQNYPGYYGASTRDINTSLKEAAQKNVVHFVDNERIFGRLFLQGEHKDDYYSFDKWHCNEKGYGVMARNVYDSMVAHHMVEGDFRNVK